MTRERRVRRALVLLGLVPFLLALGFAFKVAVMLGHDRDGRAALEATDPLTARAEFAANARFNVLESWVAPYDEGVARFQLGDHAGAVTFFSTALPLAPVDEVCRVRVNLALSHEALGDAALATAQGQTGDALRKAQDTARDAWARGREVLAPDDCLTGSAQQPRDPVAGSVDERLAGKLEDSEDQPEESQDDQPAEQQQGEGQTPKEKRQEQELEQRNESGQQQRQRREQAEQEREGERDTARTSGGRGNGGGQSGDDPGAPPAISW